MPAGFQSGNFHTQYNQSDSLQNQSNLLRFQLRLEVTKIKLLQNQFRLEAISITPTKSVQIKSNQFSLLRNQCRLETIKITLSRNQCGLKAIRVTHYDFSLD